METIPLNTVNERAMSLFTHKFVVKAADLSDTAGTAKTLDLNAALPAGSYIRDVAFLLVTAFDGGATSALKLDVGYNGATLDDADAFIDNVELHADGTEITGDSGRLALTAVAPDTSTVDNTYGQQENDVITSLRTQLNALIADLGNANALFGGYVLREAADLEAVFTATGANLTELTTGEVWIFANIVDLNKVK